MFTRAIISAVPVGVEFPNIVGNSAEVFVRCLFEEEYQRGSQRGCSGG